MPDDPGDPQEERLPPTFPAIGRVTRIGGVAVFPKIGGETVRKTRRGKKIRTTYEEHTHALFESTDSGTVRPLEPEEAEAVAAKLGVHLGGGRRTGKRQIKPPQ